jgi:hypothetical protein
MNRRFSITRFLAIIIKEFILMRRDRVTFGMMAGIPLLQLTLFGFGSNEWTLIRSGLEDVFIHLMDPSKGNFAK